MSKKDNHQPAGHKQEVQAAAPAEAAEKDGAAPADAAAEAEKFRDLAMRTAADFDNYRKRAAREKEEAIRYANSSLLGDLLPLIDNFELGLEAARSAPGADAILQGLGMVAKQFRDFLGSSGLEEVKTEGAAFDPNLMEAVGHEADAKTPEGNVLRQTRRGYKLRDRLLRPASVVVSKGPAE
ncbi:MAG: nucleotide exchange factor GrpE [Chthoniobacterales bacterium]|nr:nucleotide exchange factor GrpE [Chthoniobacterales bacterium]